MKEFPHVPAAFINAIADEGSKKEAVEWLQKTWNELCAVKAELTALRSPPSPVGGLLEADIIRDQSAFLRQAVPKKYHDFFDRLCRTALRSESGRAGVIEECARVCDRLAKLTSDAAYIGLEMAAKEIRALKSAPGNENAVPQAQDNAGDGSDASSQTRYKPAGTAPDPTKGAAELSREQIEEIRKEFRCIPVEQDELNTLCDMALRGGRGDGLIAEIDALDNAERCNQPMCNDSGCYATQARDGSPEPNQCEFCYTNPRSLFNAKLNLRKTLRPLSGERVRVPREPTMGQWDDFCAVHHVPFDKFIVAYKAMLPASSEGAAASGEGGADAN